MGQAAQSAQIHKVQFEHKALVNASNGPKKSQSPSPARGETTDIVRLTQIILDLKAKVCVLHRKPKEQNFAEK